MTVGIIEIGERKELKRNKKILIIFILVIFGVLIGRCMPFLFASNYSIKEGKVSREPNGKRYLLNEEEKKEFVKIQRMSIFFTKRNGKQVVLMDVAPCLVINGTSYKSMQLTCDNYTKLARKIYDEY